MQGFKHFFSPPYVDKGRIGINGIGVREPMPATIIDRPHGKSDYLFMLFYDSCQMNAGGQRPFFEPHTLMIWTPNHPHYYGNPQKPFRHSWIHCEGPFVQKCIRTLKLPTNEPILQADPTAAERYLIAMHDEITSHTRPDFSILCNLFENWLRHVYRDRQRVQDPQAVPRKFIELRQFIELNHDQPLHLKDLAQRVDLSIPYLCSQFKRYFGLSPVDYIIRQRLHRAVYLLADHNLSITQIADRVGYADLFHFSKLFKKHYGVSPAGMRRGEKSGVSRQPPPQVRIK